MNEKRESSATIDRKKSIRDAVRVLTIGKNGVAYQFTSCEGLCFGRRLIKEELTDGSGSVCSFGGLLLPVAKDRMRC